MIQAELKGKIGFAGFEESDVREIERMKDLLTSNVFGVLKNLSAESWASLLPEELVDDYRGELVSVEFWPRYAGHTAVSALPAAVRNSEPDVVIETGKYLAIVEVKHLSSFGRQVGDAEHQLIRAWRLGSELARNMGKKFHLITLTPFAKSVEPEVRSLFHDEEIGRGVHVRYWEDVYTALYKLAARDPGGIEGRFLGDLVEYLRVKGFDAEKILEDKQRALSYWFGEEDADYFLSAIKELLGTFDEDSDVLTIPVASLTGDDLPKLAAAFSALYASEVISRSPLPNAIDDDKSILSNFLLEDGDWRVSDFFYRILSEAYYCPYLRLNGMNNFSVKARIRSRGNAEISLFTVRSRDLAITVQRLR